MASATIGTQPGRLTPTAAAPNRDVAQYEPPVLEAAAPATANPFSNVAIGFGLGALIAAGTGVCISPITAWLAETPTAYIATPFIAGLIGAVVGALAGVMSQVEAAAHTE